MGNQGQYDNTQGTGPPSEWLRRAEPSTALSPPSLRRLRSRNTESGANNNAPSWRAALHAAAACFDAASKVGCGASRHCHRRTGATALGRGRVKRRSQPIIGQYNVAARTVIWRRFRIYYLKGNRIAGFRQGKGFSHGLGRTPSIVSRSMNDRCWRAKAPSDKQQRKVRCPPPSQSRRGSKRLNLSTGCGELDLSISPLPIISDAVFRPPRFCQRRNFGQLLAIWDG